MRRRWAGLSVALLAWAASLAAGPEDAAARPAYATRQPLSPPQMEALRTMKAAPTSSIDLQLVVPAEGTVIPWTYPTPELRWRERHAANVFRVRIRRGRRGSILAQALTDLRTHRFEEAAWLRVKEAVGEGGSFLVEVLAVSIMPSGRITRPPVEVRTLSRFSKAGEGPTGRIVYSRLMRPAGSLPGPIHALAKSSILVQVSMEEGNAEVLRDTIPDGDKPKNRQRTPEEIRTTAVASHSRNYSDVPARPGLPAYAVKGQTGEAQCMSCHTTSPDGRYLAVATRDEAAAPRAPAMRYHLLGVLDANTFAALRSVDGGMFPRFSRRHPARMLYSAASAPIGRKLRTIIYLADLHVMDVRTGEDRPLPGADHPERCELFSDWSPDGTAVVFSRSREREPCSANRGRQQIATVRVDAGGGARATPLEGAHDNGKSNVQPRYSPDGQWIVFRQADAGYASRGSSDLWIVPAEGGEARRLSVSTDATESWHAFSPDGRWLAFKSNRDRVDQPRLYMSRFYEDGTVAPAIGVPGASGPKVQVHTFDWGP